MSNSGDWIKLHRSMEKSLAMSDDWLCRLWISCLLRANWRVRYFKGEAIQPGQFAFSYRIWAELLGVSKGKLQRGLKRLEAGHQISIKAGRNFTIVTICNWTTYQGNDDTERDANGTVGGTLTGTQTGRKRVTIEEGKKERTKEGKKLAASAACTEPAKADVVPADSVLEFSVTGKAKTWHLTADKLAEYQTTFDTLDVLAECRKARQWILDNPAKRKTGRGMPAFLGRWLTRAVDSGRGRASSGSGPAKRGFNEPDHSGLQQWLEESDDEAGPALLGDQSGDYEGTVPF